MLNTIRLFVTHIYVRAYANTNMFYTIMTTKKENEKSLTFNAKRERSPNRNHCLIIDTLTLIGPSVFRLNVINNKSLTKAFQSCTSWHLTVCS